MMRTFFAMMLLAIVIPAHAGEFWSKLWRNADQQGDALMQHGDASNAAKVYADPRRKAYAKLQAGDYQGAAQDLDKLHDSDADYNRGNALAHAGDLQGALDAYDAALKSDPNNQDAKHNRELVAGALKQQPPQQQKSGDKKSQDDKNQGQQGKDASGANKQDGQGKQGEQSGQDKNGQQKNSGQSDNQSGKSQDASAQNKPQQPGQEGQKSGDGKNQAGQARNGKQSGQGNEGNKEQASPAAQAGSADDKAGAKNDAEQARRDAEASLAKPVADGKNGAAMEQGTDDGKALPATPKSEQQIAQEQWLRSIPDDPGGLLRRKFMIEHMIRQQKVPQ